MNYRILLITPFFLIFFGFSELIRDFFDLPFYGDRLYFLYLLIIFSALLFYLSLSKVFKYYKFSKIAGVEYFFYLFIFLFFIIDLCKSKKNYFVPLQLLSVLIYLYYYRLVTKKLSQSLINKCYSFFTWFISLCMIFIWLAWFSGNDSLIDLKTRNSLPYIILGTFYYLKSLNNKSNFILFCFFLLTLICETKGALLLFLIISFFEFYNKKYKFGHNLYTSLIALLFFAPFIIIIIVNSYFSSNYDDLIELEKYRYYIRDDLSSFISRIFGGGYLLLLNFHYIFPIGVLDNIDKEQLLFWGYPIHNYLYLLILQYGVIGIIFIFFLLKLVRNIMIQNLSLGISLLYCLLNFNDFYIGFIIFLLPMFDEFNPKSLDLNFNEFTYKSFETNKYIYNER
jgi:hypothetical protein